MKKKNVTVERVFASNIKDVWKALTEPALMKQWYFDIPGFRPEVGYQFSFTGGPSPEKQYVHLCEVTEAIPEARLAYSWKYQGYAGISFVTIELTREGTKTRVRLTHTGIGSFPQEITDFAIHNFEEGWNAIINESLKGFLEK